jgi:methionyl-tRNA synthetase
VLALGEQYQQPIKLVANELKPEIDESIENYIECFSKVRTNDVVSVCFDLIAKINKYVSDQKPWSLINTSKTDFERIISSSLYGIIYANLLLSAIMPKSSEKIFDRLGVQIASLKDIPLLANQEFTLKKPENLFNRI